MRRRLTVAIVSVVAGALLVAGLGTLLLSRRAAREDARDDLVEQAETVAQAAEDARRPQALRLLRQALNLQNATVVALRQAPPELRPAELAAGETVSGFRGGSVFAAAPVRRANGGVAVVVLERHVPGQRGGVGFFVLSAAVALLVAAALADRLGRRITRPLEEAERATGRIAAGDLSTAVKVDQGADPEVVSLAGSINTMAEALARSRGTQRQFLLSVSHDLRTPLTSIRGFAEAIADGAAADTTKAAKVIASESRRLERLVGDLLDLAKLESGRFALDMRTVDVAEVVVDTAEGFRPAAEEARIALDVDVMAKRGMAASADPDRLAQVVANLVENALKFAASRITVRAYRDDDRSVVVEVADDGPGIPREDLTRVFEPLYQSDRQPARAVGSGLGLAIVSELVTAMGGTVTASAPPTGGTTIHVRVAPPR